MSTTNLKQANVILAADARRVSAKCETCAFGRIVAVADIINKVRLGSKAKSSVSFMCECHVARPTMNGFPVVKTDDFCALHVNSKTLERTFSGLIQGGM